MENSGNPTEFKFWTNVKGGDVWSMAQNIDHYSEVQTYLDVLCFYLLSLAASVGVTEKYKLILQGE